MRSDEEVDVSELAADLAATTELLTHPHGAQQVVQVYHIAALEGPEADKRWSSSNSRFAIGAHPSNDLVIDDGAVSRFHCEIRIKDRRAWLADLDSRNGTLVDGVAVGVGGLRDSSLIRLGRSVLRFQFGTEHVALAVSESRSFGSLVGSSVAMRSAFALLERAAKSDITLLIEGETGTGKEGAAESVHQASARRDKPFVVVDCSAMPTNLLESELFGYERGAFTGATSRHVGAFEEAQGGTVFLDEIGELSQELQPKLLRVLERKQIRRLGSNTYLPVDVRVIAATNRDLRVLVNEGTLRSDIYYRLAVLRIILPPLRERPEDIPELVGCFVPALGIDATQAKELLSEELLARMQSAVWPGNVRELRNYLERCVVLEEAMPLHDAGSAEPSPNTPPIDPRVPYSDAKRAVLNDFERRYFEALLKLHDGNVSRAARACGMDRVYLHRLLRRHGLRG
ncbi:MAG: sigma 54-interacting transcriptional regulator [Polyangiaceae bacterium]|nr:sigma 54-interacting transcriptional regulator [Polyangiaceae bacterium]